MKKEAKPHIYLFWGDDRFSIGERLAFWKNEFLKKHGGQTLWAEDASSIHDVVLFEQHIRTAFRTATLFQQPRLTIIKDCDELSPTVIDTISSLLPQIPDLHFVVLTAKKYEKKKALFAALESLQKQGKAFIQEYRTPTGAALISWTQKRLTAKGKEMDPQTLRYFLSCTVSDLSGKMDIPHLGIVANEIDKICSYAASSLIAKRDIDQIVSGTELPRIFDLEDAIFQQELQRALRITHTLVTQRKERGKNAFIGIITFLTKEIRGLLMIQAGHHPSSWSPQRLWHAKRKISSLGADQLRCIYKNLLLAEQKLKSSSFNAGMLFDALLLRATAEDPRTKGATPWQKAR